MRFIFFLAFIACVNSSFFAQTAADPKIISGIILLNEKSAPDFKKILADLPGNWYVPTDSLNISGKTAVFSTPGATVMLAYLDYAVNPDEIHIASGISWLWKTAEAETKNHKAQLIISVLGNPAKTVELYRIFTRVAGGVMSALPDAPGIYMNSQYLIISKGYYLEAARNMGRDGFPLYLWTYFGILQQGTKSSGYTYGLSEFGWPEMEIVESMLALQDSHALLYAAAQKAISGTEKWTTGQQVELDEGRKIKVSVSPAKYIGEGGPTIKIE
jgi:hypothetical protein